MKETFERDDAAEKGDARCVKLTLSDGRVISVRPENTNEAMRHVEAIVKSGYATEEKWWQFECGHCHRISHHKFTADVTYRYVNNGCEQ